ncbi:uncharacterized protein AMSG_05997 [Thecamonas trahens ATCC 50062]|uniref:Dolichyl-diphosphooligosaccharide-protein glycosyltransferase subunit OST5 n=1 Tax=Thecamonas trahens ATCC 50062 TaxID=461836 RepID=A0A0L0DEH5_THETB|nr:hypothetical protein AMSG_05997 [Thecamonas trahens ATCC 50062]KNC49728.1 hypothetical protein AMSG_05997 [Thecamonas trahens ATCC 50062]|eukprot:XP_013757515.1 hypothetical protein AMSG_05997 [Thecamonas trahens ATCC 50062]
MVLSGESYAWSPPLPPSLFTTLAFVLAVVGLALGAAFFLHQVTTAASAKGLPVELGLAAAASVTLGLAGLFIMLSVGIYV